MSNKSLFCMHMFSALENGNVSLIMSSPEALNNKMTTLLKLHIHQICILAFDEVHCVLEC